MGIKQKVEIQYIKLIKTAVRNKKMLDSWILETMFVLYKNVGVFNKNTNLNEWELYFTVILMFVIIQSLSFALHIILEIL